MGRKWSLIGRGWSLSGPRHFWGIFVPNHLFLQKKKVNKQHETPRRRETVFLEKHKNEKDAHRNSASFDVPDSSPSLILTPFGWAHSFVGPCWGHSFVGPILGDSFGPCWAHSFGPWARALLGPFIWALLGPFIWALGPGPLGPFIWARANGPILRFCQERGQNKRWGAVRHVKRSGISIRVFLVFKNVVKNVV